MQTNEDAAPPTEEIAVEHVLAEELREALKRLSPEEQCVLSLHYFEGLTTEASAKALFCSERTYRRRLERALEKLGRLLGAQAPEPRSQLAIEIGVLSWVALRGAHASCPRPTRSSNWPQPPMGSAKEHISGATASGNRRSSLRRRSCRKGRCPRRWTRRQARGELRKRTRALHVDRRHRPWGRRRRHHRQGPGEGGSEVASAISHGYLRHGRSEPGDGHFPACA